MTEFAFEDLDIGGTLLDDVGDATIGEQVEASKRLAVASVEPLWPYFAASVSEADFTNRWEMSAAAVDRAMVAAMKPHALKPRVVAAGAREAAHDALLARWREQETAKASKAASETFTGLMAAAVRQGLKAQGGVEQVIFKAPSHDYEFAGDGPDSAEISRLVGKYVRLVLFNEHGVAADYARGRFVGEPHYDRNGGGAPGRMGGDVVEWLEDGREDSYPISVDDIHTIVRLEEPAEVGQPRLFASKTAGLSDLDEAGLDKELRRVMVQQNNTRTPEAQESLKAWRKQVEDEIASRKKTSAKTAGYAIVSPKGDHLWGMVYDTEEGARAHHDAVKDRTDDLVPRGLKDWKVQKVDKEPNRTYDKSSPRNPFQPHHGSKTAAEGPLPEHLREFWGNRTDDPRDKAMFCPKQSRKTPAIPWHNGYPTCLACGKDISGLAHKSTTAGSFRDMMNEYDTKVTDTGVCKHCGKPIEKRGGLWYVTGAEAAGDICIANKGTVRQYGGHHEPGRKTSALRALLAESIDTPSDSPSFEEHMYEWGYSHGKQVRDGDTPFKEEWKNADGSAIDWRNSDKAFPTGYRDGLEGKPMRYQSAKTAGWDHYRKCNFCDKDIEQRNGVYVHTETGLAEGPARGQFPPHNAEPQPPPSWEMQMSTMLKGAPFAGYEDFAACVAANQDKDDPSAYCGKIKHQVEDNKTSARSGPTIDSAEGYEYTPAPDWVQRACNRRFGGGGPTGVDPKKPGQYLHGIGNFWDGPSEIKDNGDHTLSYTNPYNGETDHFDENGPVTKTSAKTAAGSIRWTNDTHMGVGYLVGLADNDDVYEVYFNPNMNPTPCAWARYGPEGDTGLGSQIERAGGFTTMQEAMRDAEANAARTGHEGSAKFGEFVQCPACDGVGCGRCAWKGKVLTKPLEVQRHWSTGEFVQCPACDGVGCGRCAWKGKVLTKPLEVQRHWSASKTSALATLLSLSDIEYDDEDLLSDSDPIGGYPGERTSAVTDQPMPSRATYPHGAPYACERCGHYRDERACEYCAAQADAAGIRGGGPLDWMFHRLLPFGSTAAKSDVCPKCGEHMDDVTVTGDTLRAKCDNCGWSGTKTKKQSAGEPSQVDVVSFARALRIQPSDVWACIESGGSSSSVARSLRIQPEDVDRIRAHFKKQSAVEALLESEGAFFKQPTPPNAGGVHTRREPDYNRRLHDMNAAEDVDRNVDQERQRRHQEYWDAHPEEHERHMQQNAAVTGAHVHWAVNEDAEGTERYQSQPRQTGTHWDDAWDAGEAPQSYLDQGRAAHEPENPFADRLTTVRQSALRALAEAGENLEGLERSEEFGDGARQPLTTRPRVMPTEHQQPSMSNPPSSSPMVTQPATPEMGSFDVTPGEMVDGMGGMGGGLMDPMMPTVDQMVAAKIARMAKQVRADNPSMSEDEAKRLAARTIARFPQMVGKPQEVQPR